ncbi:MAG: hypothetical protein XE11_2642 [Methanomicrobiales archaeon 53_19]|nr:MAG: hypothetical protein XD88_2108 [Methanocalculus sp. 52_23]KUK99795.1 MAG: hypothetical protein XE11_2642 [Methanomicrobiales archaeon 53_19]
MYFSENIICLKDTHQDKRGATMSVQYIYDSAGKKTGVIIPIDLWETLRDKRLADEPVGISDPGKYRGIYRDLKVDLKTEVRKLRDEWTQI